MNECDRGITTAAQGGAMGRAARCRPARAGAVGMGRRAAGGRMPRAAVWMGMAAAGPLALASGAAGQVEIPPGWEIRTIVEAVEGRYCGWPDINDRGDAVFDCGDLEDQSTREIYLYARGELTQITHDDLKDGFPKINNKREIVWARELDGDGDFDIVLLRDGEMEVVAAEPHYEIGADINDAGHIVWEADLDGGGNNRVVLYFDGDSTRQISFNSLANNLARINQSSEIIWTRYNFGGAPWYSDVMMYQDGETLQLTQGRKQINFAGINDLGQVVWVSPQGGLERWNNGVTVTLLPDGDNAQINNRGFISVSRWNPGGRYSSMWLLRDGGWLQLTDGPEDAINGAINARAEIVWQHGERGFGIELFTRSSGFAGDLDLDGDVDLRDFAVLASCLGGDQPLNLDCREADMDQNEQVDIDDYAQWVMLLQGPE